MENIWKPKQYLRNNEWSIVFLNLIIKMADHHNLLTFFQEKTNKSDKRSYQDLSKACHNFIEPQIPT